MHSTRNVLNPIYYNHPIICNFTTELENNKQHRIMEMWVFMSFYYRAFTIIRKLAKHKVMLKLL